MNPKGKRLPTLLEKLLLGLNKTWQMQMDQLKERKMRPVKDVLRFGATASSAYLYTGLPILLCKLD